MDAAPDAGKLNVSGWEIAAFGGVIERGGRRPPPAPPPGRRGAPLGKGHCHVAVVGSTPFALAFSSMIDFSQSVRPGSILS